MRSSHGKGRARRRGLLSALLVSLAALGALAIPAQAAYEETGTIGETGLTIEPSGVAVDEANDYLYVSALGNQYTARYNLGGTVAGDPINTGVNNLGVAVKPGTGTVYSVSYPGPTATAPGTFTLFNSAGTVTGGPHATGLMAIATQGKIAADSAGDLYMPSWLFGNSVLRFSEAGTAKDPITGAEENELVAPTSVDVDSAGNVYVLDQVEAGTGTGGRVQKFDSSGDFVTEVATADAGDGFVAVAVNRASGDVFILENGEAETASTVQITGYEEDEGDYAESEQFDTSEFGPVPPGSIKNQLTVDARDGAVYVSDLENDVVRVFTEPDPPVATTGGASGVTTTSATLAGEINPGGGNADCVFFYGEAGGSLDQEAECLTNPVSGEESVDVSAELTGLSLNTEYEYALAAENVNGSDEGDVESFTTLPNPPAATTGSASGVTQTAATLSGTVNASDAGTSCVFQYGTSTAYGSSAPCSVNPVTGSADEAVSAVLSGLTPGTTYHFRVVAENAGGKVNGLDKTFTTAAHTCETDASLCPKPPEKPADPAPAPAAPAPPATQKPKPLKCKKGFTKKKVKGKQKCVKVKKKKGKGKKK